MILSTLIQDVDVIQNSMPQSNPEISSVCFDSRKITPGALFVAIPGTQTDGHQYMQQAMEQGAAAIVCQEMPPHTLSIPCIEVDCSKEALGTIASAFYGYPSQALKLVGVTGTNGKTTTATLLYRLFKELGYACGLISTIENYVDNIGLPSHHTTPDSLELNQLLAKMVAKGCAYCFMEVSSHAVAQARIAGLHFSGAIFSNLTHDHLDYHGSFAAYLQCKKSFFDRLSPQAFALVNGDDKNGKVMIQNTAAHTYTYACKSPANFHGRVVEQSIEGMLLKIEGTEVSCSFIGRHNAYNLLAVYAAARLLGVDGQETLPILSNLKSVPGRLEYIKGKKGITAIVDYAHTPDALKNVLDTLQEIRMADQSLYTVVGCGGDRDKAKRSKMARIAFDQSTQVIFTSDNPRSEDPMEIIQEMLQGVTPQERAHCICITDRREAIKTALLMAPPKSMVLVAGKGHENYQEVKGIRVHFDDKELLTEYLA